MCCSCVYSISVISTRLRSVVVAQPRLAQSRVRALGLLARSPAAAPRPGARHAGANGGGARAGRRGQAGRAGARKRRPQRACAACQQRQPLPGRGPARPAAPPAARPANRPPRPALLRLHLPGCARVEGAKGAGWSHNYVRESRPL